MCATCLRIAKPFYQEVQFRLAGSALSFQTETSWMENSHMHRIEDVPERLVVSLILPKERPIKDVCSILRLAGFKSMDDFYFLPRKEKSPPWQSSTLASVDFFVNERPSGYESICNRLSVSYLFACLPVKCGANFIEMLSSLCRNLSAELEYAGKTVSLSEVSHLIQRWGAELLAGLNETPGSESLAIQIQQSYP